MQKIKGQWQDLLHNSLMILLISLISGLSLYLLYLILHQALEVNINVDKVSNFLIFIILLCLAILIFLIYHSFKVQDRVVAFSCTQKLSNYEYREMIEKMTKEEVSKLKQSKEYKDFLNKRNRSPIHDREVLEEMSFDSDSDRRS